MDFSFLSGIALKVYKEMKRILLLLPVIIFILHGCRKNDTFPKEKGGYYISKIHDNNYLAIQENSSESYVSKQHGFRDMNLNDKNQIITDSYSLEKIRYDANNEVIDYSFSYPFYHKEVWDTGILSLQGQVDITCNTKYIYRADGKVSEIVASPLRYHSYYLKPIDIGDGVYESRPHDIEKFEEEYSLVKYFYNLSEPLLLDSISIFTLNNEMRNVVIEFLDFDHRSNPQQIKVKTYRRGDDKKYRLSDESQILVKYDDKPHYAKDLFNHLGWLPTYGTGILYTTVFLAYAPANNVVEVIETQTTYNNEGGLSEVTGKTHKIDYTYNTDGYPITARGTVTGDKVIDGKIDVKFEYQR